MHEITTNRVFTKIAPPHLFEENAAEMDEPDYDDEAKHMRMEMDGELL